MIEIKKIYGENFQQKLQDISVRTKLRIRKTETQRKTKEYRCKDENEQQRRQ